MDGNKKKVSHKIFVRQRFQCFNVSTFSILDEWLPVMTRLPPAPDAVLHLVKCGYKKNIMMQRTASENAACLRLLSIFGLSDLLQILRKQAAFSFAVLCIIMFCCSVFLGP